MDNALQTLQTLPPVSVTCIVADVSQLAEHSYYWQPTQTWVSPKIV